jgi:hypothetical protein
MVCGAHRHGAGALPLACRDLPELTGLARGTIYRVLRDFQQAGALAVVGRQLHVLDAGYLAQVEARLSGQNGLHTRSGSVPITCESPFRSLP